MTTALAQCTCKHDYQDKRYGKGIRVMNKADKQGKEKNRYRCTVCDKEREITK